jgi:hypothetical protein
MEALRKRQQKEVLDVWKNIYSQVYSREKKQVKALEESLTPLKTRDLEVEISLDKLTEQMNKVLEAKLANVENLLLNYQGVKRPDYRQAFEGLTQTGDFVALWNSLVRMYQTTGLSRATQEQIKVKLQEVIPNIDAMCYGLNQYIDILFDKGYTDVELFNLLKALSVYLTVQQQSKTFSFQTLSASSIEPAYQQILSDQSEERISRLKEIESQGQLIRKHFPITNDFEDRYKGLQEVFGADPSVSKDELRKLPFGQLQNIANRAGVANADRTAIEKAIEVGQEQLLKMRNEVRGVAKEDLDPNFIGLYEQRKNEVKNLQRLLRTKPSGLEAGEELLQKVKGDTRKFSETVERPRTAYRPLPVPKPLPKDELDLEDKEKKEEKEEDYDSEDSEIRLIEEKKEDELIVYPTSGSYAYKLTGSLLDEYKRVGRELDELDDRIARTEDDLKSAEKLAEKRELKNLISELSKERNKKISEEKRIYTKGEKVRDGSGKPKALPKSLALMCEESSSSSSESEDEELEAKRVAKKEKLPHYKRKMPFLYREEKNDSYK